jgi:hypothetical protein
MVYKNPWSMLGSLHVFSFASVYINTYNSSPAELTQYKDYENTSYIHCHLHVVYDKWKRCQWPQRMYLDIDCKKRWQHNGWWADNVAVLYHVKWSYDFYVQTIRKRRTREVIQRDHSCIPLHHIIGDIVGEAHGRFDCTIHLRRYWETSPDGKDQKQKATFHDYYIRYKDYGCPWIVQFWLHMLLDYISIMPTSLTEPVPIPIHTMKSVRT